MTHNEVINKCITSQKSQLLKLLKQDDVYHDKAFRARVRHFQLYLQRMMNTTCFYENGLIISLLCHVIPIRVIFNQDTRENTVQPSLTDHSSCFDFITSNVGVEQDAGSDYTLFSDSAKTQVRPRPRFDIFTRLFKIIFSCRGSIVSIPWCCSQHPD